MVSGLPSNSSLAGNSRCSVRVLRGSFLIMDGTITFEDNLANDDTANIAGIFDDDDPFNLPPPLPAVDEFGDQDGGVLGAADANTKDGEKPETKKRKVNRSPRPRLDEARYVRVYRGGSSNFEIGSNYSMQFPSNWRVCVYNASSHTQDYL